MEEHTHRELMRLRANPDRRILNPECAGVCVALYGSASWTVYRCQGCQAQIAAYEGQAHVWNYIAARQVDHR